MSFLHGIRVTEIPSAASSAIAIVATACIGLVVTAPAASADVFPLNTPVLVGAPTSAMTIADAIAAAGPTGTMKGALVAIGDQVRTPVVIVRVAPGADSAATETAVIGADVAGIKTGMQALLAAEAQVKYRPRIIGAPGLDTKAVAIALAAVAKRLRGMAYAAAVGADRAAVIAYILGAEASFDAAKNPTSQLTAGQLTISYRYTPVAPLECLSLEQEITDDYAADFGLLVANA